MEPHKNNPSLNSCLVRPPKWRGNGNIQSKLCVFIYLEIFLCNLTFGLDFPQSLSPFLSPTGFCLRAHAEGVGLLLSGREV